jgi:uncharacterized protein
VSDKPSPRGTGTELHYRLIPGLAELGSQAVLEGKLDLQRLDKGAMELRLPEGVDYQLRLSNTGGGVLLQGSACAHALTECSRCLAEASVDLEADVEAYYILRPRDAGLAEEDDEAQLVGADGLVDLAEPICAGLIYELPYVILCDEDCAGLCPQCGANLNEGSCGCEDAVDPDHPLAALRQLIPGN